MHWQMNACGGTGELVGCVWKPTSFPALGGLFNT